MKFALNRIKHYSRSGFLVELISSKYKDTPFKIHSYLVKIKKGYTRAQHYHKKKKEWIAPVYGETLLQMKNIETKKKKEYLLDFESKSHKIIYIPPYWAHSIKAVNGDSVIVVFSLSSEDKKDTVPYEM